VTLARAVLNGERLALARVLTQVENDTPEGRAALDELFAHTGKAHLIGITGSPGTGKSSLVNQLALHYRRPAVDAPLHRVGIVAVDPSSPFSGGALLGDRVRMRELSGDPDVFIRSMASRGTLGGLARSTAAVVQVLDAAGFDVILIETVGAGQSEVDIARLAHTTVVVEAPGLGDDIQAIKAGILEIADILAVNKADRPGVENTERALRMMLELASPGRPPEPQASGQPVDGLNETWTPPILRTVASLGTGVDAVAEAIDQHELFLKNTGRWRERDTARLQNEFEMLVRETLLGRWKSALSEERYHTVLASLYERKLSPYRALEELLKDGSPECKGQGQ
jgi:LAO/AO transport system kinase